MRYLVALLITMLLTTCGPETRMLKKTFVIKNTLEFPINITILLNQEIIISETLQTNQRFIGEELETTVDITNNPNGSSAATSLGGNIIEFVFNNERKSIQTFSDIDNGLGFFSEPEEFNLLRTGNYIDIGNEELQYIITQQDFDNATPCGGPCE